MSRALREIAFHEAGHAVACIALREDFGCVSIEFNDDSAGRVKTVPLSEEQQEYYELPSRPAAIRWWDNRIIIAMAGNICQAMAGYAPFSDKEPFAVDTDSRWITQHVPEDFYQIDADGRLCLPEKYTASAHEILAAWWPGVKALVAALLVHKTLSACCVRAIVKAAMDTKSAEE